jgi:hypothetical protein
MFKAILPGQIILAYASMSLAFAAPQKTSNVFLITVDGLRWQEVFAGAEKSLMVREYGVSDTNRFLGQFWRSTPEERRQVLMPFFWETIASKGQLYGNGSKGSVALVTNGKNFTYPGFNEIFTGAPDDRIDKNEKRLNPNVSVLEWLHRKQPFAGQVAGFANWEVHPYILNTERSGIPVWSGYDNNLRGAQGSRLELVQQMQGDTTSLWPDMSFDAFYFHAAQEYIKEKRPRLVWVAFSETDEWGHEGDYGHYLQSAHRVDNYIHKLWDTVQSMEFYRDKTSFIIACDHGRGSGPHWRDHGAKIEGAERVWQAYIGPDTSPLGERKNVPQVTHSQIAATLAALLGEDYHKAVPRSGVPIADVYISSLPQNIR